MSELTASLPEEMQRWSPLAQGQYLEIMTLLSPYILCSQGDRMLMAHSVEGRFPFLDKNVVELAASLPPAHKLHVLDEKHVLKRAAGDLLPPEIVRRPKQPYRAPDALSFAADPPPWVHEIMSEEAIRKTGIFEPAVAAILWKKCQARSSAQLSNTDNMALVGILSTELLAREVAGRPADGAEVHWKTFIDRAGDS